MLHFFRHPPVDAPIVGHLILLGNNRWRVRIGQFIIAWFGTLLRTGRGECLMRGHDRFASDQLNEDDDDDKAESENDDNWRQQAMWLGFEADALCGAGKCVVIRSKRGVDAGVSR